MKSQVVKTFITSPAHVHSVPDACSEAFLIFHKTSGKRELSYYGCVEYGWHRLKLILALFSHVCTFHPKVLIIPYYVLPS